MRSATVIATAVMAGALTPSALAVGNGPTSSVYDHQGTQVQTQVAAVTTTKPAPKPAATVTTSGTLPFTGVDLGVFAAGGVLLVATGFGLRRATRKTDGTA